MTALRETPGTVSESNRHRRPWKDGSRTPLVELKDPDAGTLRQGKFRVPARLTHTIPHTNQGIEFENHVNKMLDKWKRWLQLEGWELVGTPKVLGPFDIPTTSPLVPENMEEKEYYVRARFRRLYPMYAKMSDIEEINRLAQVHNIDMNKAWRPWSYNAGMGATPDSEWGDPLKMAEERRQRKGIKRSDYLIDHEKDLSKPLGHISSPEVERALRRRKA